MVLGRFETFCLLARGVVEVVVGRLGGGHGVLCVYNVQGCLREFVRSHSLQDFDPRDEISFVFVLLQ